MGRSDICVGPGGAGLEWRGGQHPADHVLAMAAELPCAKESSQRFTIVNYYDLHILLGSIFISSLDTKKLRHRNVGHPHTHAPLLPAPSPRTRSLSPESRNALPHTAQRALHLQLCTWGPILSLIPSQSLS